MYLKSNSIRGRVVKNDIQGERLELEYLLGFPAQVRILSYAFMEYFCNECNGLVELGPTETIICNFCGSRVLYKSRTKQILQYEAKRL